MTKNLVTFSLMIFIFIVIAILGAGVFINQNKANTILVSNQNSSTGAFASLISMAEVAKHSTADDCWMIVSNKVYNVTNYINMHPAGPDTIIPYCGKDATVPFDTKGGKGSHSNRAQNILDKYYVGNVNG